MQTVLRIFHDFETIGLVSVGKLGRNVIPRLTPKGWELVRDLLQRELTIFLKEGIIIYDATPQWPAKVS